jgi:cytidyltransferase-like protein
MEKETIKRLYILQVHDNGISKESYSGLNDVDKNMLELKDARYYVKPGLRKQIKVVMSGGAFDILHMGHVYTLTEAKKHGDVLVVSVARDEVVKRKGKLVHGQEYRAKMVEFLKPVDLVLLGIETPMQTFERVRPDVIVYGYDQKPFLQPDGVEIVQLEEHFQEQKFKTSKIIRDLGL